MGHVIYAESRTREQLDQLLHYAHPIPVRHGFTDDYVANNYPGWSFNQFMEILNAAGIVDRFHNMAPADAQLDRLAASTGVRRIPQPPVCCRDVIALGFTDANHWCIQWRNGDTTTRLDSVDPEGHSAVDGFCRLACTEHLPDEKALTTIGFFHRARAFFAAHGIIRLVRVITDNGANYKAPPRSPGP